MNAQSIAGPKAAFEADGVAGIGTGGRQKSEAGAYRRAASAITARCADYGTGGRALCIFFVFFKTRHG